MNQRNSLRRGNRTDAEATESQDANEPTSNEPAEEPETQVYRGVWRYAERLSAAVPGRRQRLHEDLRGKPQQVVRPQPHSARTGVSDTDALAEEPIEGRQHGTNTLHHSARCSRVFLL